MQDSGFLKHMHILRTTATMTNVNSPDSFGLGGSVLGRQIQGDFCVAGISKQQARMWLCSISSASQQFPWQPLQGVLHYVLSSLSCLLQGNYRSWRALRQKLLHPLGNLLLGYSLILLAQHRGSCYTHARSITLIPSPFLTPQNKLPHIQIRKNWVCDNL